MNETSLSPTPSLAEEWRYAPQPGYWDEAVLPSGFPRRHWRKLSVAMRRMTFRQFSRYWQSGVQLLREASIGNNAATYPGGNDRPLPPDPVPLVVASEVMGAD